jgi:hypothetical protein
MATTKSRSRLSSILFLVDNENPRIAAGAYFLLIVGNV